MRKDKCCPAMVNAQEAGAIVDRHLQIPSLDLDALEDFGICMKYCPWCGATLP